MSDDLISPRFEADWAALIEGIPEQPADALPDRRDAANVGPPPPLDVDEAVAQAARLFEQRVTAAVDRKLINDEAARRYLAMTAPPTVRPPATGLTDFLAIPDEPVSYLVDRLWPTGGHIVLSAQYKSGKSTLAMNVAAALADGGRFLGEHRVSRPVRVAVLDLELDERALRRWLRDVSIENTERVSVVSLRGRVASFNILDPEIRAEWADLLRGHDVLIFDCLRPVLDALRLSEDKDAGIFLTAFDALLAEADIEEALIVHHAGHSSERSRGDSRILDWPDATWTLVRDREGSSDVSSGHFRASGRDVEISERGIAFNPSSRRFTYSGEGSRKASKEHVALRAIVDFLSKNAPTEDKAFKSQNAVVTAIVNSDDYDVPKSDLEKAAKKARIEGLIQHREGANSSFSLWCEDPRSLDRLINSADGDALFGGAES